MRSSAWTTTLPAPMSPARAEGVADAVVRIWEGDAVERFCANCAEERKRFSWEEMCTRIAELYERVGSDR